MKLGEADSFFEERGQAFATRLEVVVRQVQFDQSFGSLESIRESKSALDADIVIRQIDFIDLAVFSRKSSSEGGGSIIRNLVTAEIDAGDFKVRSNELGDNRSALVAEFVSCELKFSQRMFTRSEGFKKSISTSGAIRIATDIQASKMSLGTQSINQSNDTIIIDLVIRNIKSRKSVVLRESRSKSISPS